MNDTDRTDTVAASFGALAELLRVGGGELDAQRLVQVAVELIPHAADAGITLIRGDRRPTTSAATGQLPRDVDALQYRSGEGPCLEATWSNTVVVSDDLANDSRWPVFAPVCARDLGVNSMLSVRLALSREDRAALNLYARPPGAFTRHDVITVSVLAPFAGLVLQQQLHNEDVADLQTALGTSRQIGTAVGILMAGRGVSNDEAFALLRQASQDLNRKLRDIAADVTYTGELPDVPTPEKRPRRPHDREGRPAGRPERN
ncbi:hypothetical protein BKD30_10195 [Tersicoccus phoenicis]|uniref:ANTAR domain-containing protein n=1 Tax=Tersicoccus phoenicis TaxID=554083 RepID=A0A1R1L8X6_9MICC|nr:GAF and ANTAR domain-containing protein [Tersicoccus phoenicis]OMH23977.1 hypothetical protein BKD30_10195 [Tersicoccus phoenicis]